MSGNRTENLCGGASADYACCASAGTTREMSACAEKAGQGRAPDICETREAQAGAGTILLRSV
jgi:hypothetical protein